MTTQEVISRLKSRRRHLLQVDNEFCKNENSYRVAFNKDIQAAIDMIEQLQEKVDELRLEVNSWRSYRRLR